MSSNISDVNSAISSGDYDNATLLLADIRADIPRSLFEQKIAEISFHTQNLDHFDVCVFCHHTASYEGNSGIQRVVRQILTQFSYMPNIRVQLLAFNDDISSLVPLSPFQRLNLSKWSGPSLDFLNQTHESFKPDFLLLPELFYASYYNIPPNKLRNAFNILSSYAPKTVTIHYDNIPLVINGYASAAPEHKSYLDVILESDIIVPISEWSAFDLLEYGIYMDSCKQYDISSKIYPLPLAYTPIESKGIEDDLVSLKSKIHDSNFIISIGSVVPHKNQLALIQAFLLFKSGTKCPYKLIIAGNTLAGWLPYLSSLESQDIIFLLKPSDDTISFLYQNCEFSVFPSCEEGYGLPIIESVSYGKPIICANFGVMAEVANSIGCGILKVDVTNIALLSNALRTLYQNKHRFGSSEHILSSASIKSWKSYVNDLLAISSHTNHKKQLIYVNVTFLCKHDFVSGVQRVVLGILKGLIDLGFLSNIVPVCLSPSSSDFRFLNNSEYKRLSTHLRNSYPFSHNGQHFLPEPYSVFINAEIDVIYGQSPLQVSNYIHSISTDFSLTTAVVFHDAIPYLYPQFYGEETKERHVSYMESLTNYQYIFPNSHESSLDLINFYRDRGMDMSSKLFPVHLAVDDIQSASTHDPANTIVATTTSLSSAQSSLLDDLLSHNISCLLYVSSIERRKSQISVVKAYISNYPYYEKNSIPLVLVGRNMDLTYKEELNSLIIDYPLILHLDSVSDQLLEQLYSVALFTIYFSQKEGFGLPVVESLKRRIPVLLNYVSSMRELSNNGGIYPIYNSSESSLADSMLLLCENPDLVKELTRQLESFAAKNWSSYVSQLVGFMGLKKILNTSLESAESMSTSLDKIRSEREFRRRNINL